MIIMYEYISYRWYDIDIDDPHIYIDDHDPHLYMMIIPMTYLFWHIPIYVDDNLWYGME
jgi:hypothetical protein